MDRDLMDKYKSLIDNFIQSDWQKRVKSIDELQEWTERYSKKIKISQTGTFI